MGLINRCYKCTNNDIPTNLIVKELVFNYLGGIDADSFLTDTIIKMARDASDRANDAADVVDDLVIGKVRAQDVSTADGSTQEVKNTQFRNELDELPPFENGVLADTFVTMTVNGEGAVPRNLRDVGSDTINAKSFGAIPDTSLDATPFLQAAIDYCTLNNKCLNIPAGEYLVNRLKITCDIKGARGTVLKNITTDNTYGNISIHGQTDLIVERIVFDGNVSDDPDVWTEENYNDWEGGVALNISSSTRVVLKDCVTQNSKRSTLRIENCSDLVILNHVAKRGRGNFGDGVYHRKSSGTVFIKCRAEDFTRIGFVTETGSDRVSFYSCYATYGHNSSGSILSSGGEHNTGFWSENAANVSYDNCVADKAGDTGFIVTAGAYISPTGINGFSLNNCLSLSNERGFSVSTYPSTRPDAQATFANLTNCKATGCKTSFSAGLRVSTSRVIFNNCYAEMDFLSAGIQNSTFYIVGSGDTQAILNKCKIKHTSLDDDRVYDEDTNNLADFAAYVDDNYNSIEIIINNLKEVDGGNLYFKYRDGDRNLQVSDTKNIELIRCNLGEGSTFRDCSFFSFQPYPYGEVTFKECDVILGSGDGRSGKTSIAYRSSKAKIVLERCNIITKLGAFLWFGLSESSVIPYPLELLNSKITAEGKAGSYIIRFQDESTNKSNVLVKGCTFILSDATESDSYADFAPFVHAVRAGSTITALDNIYDSKHRLVYMEGSITRRAEREAKWIKTYDGSYSIIRFADYGTTEERPNVDTDKLRIGQTYYDTTLGNVVYWNGTAWVLATLPEPEPEPEPDPE